MSIKVAVLRGGPSPEYDVSLKTGANVLSLLRQWEGKYEPVDIFISKEGEWHRGGLPVYPQEALRGADVVWNALHGHYGEDGGVQKLLEYLGLPYTGSGTHACARAYDKEIAKIAYARNSFLVPKHELFTPETLTDERLVYIVRNYLHPVIVKPASGGSSIGTKLAHGLFELKDAIRDAFKHSKKVLVEEFIRGREATCGVVEDLRGEKLYAAIPAGNATAEENARIIEMAKRAHQELGLRHYSTSDFIISPRGKIYILETDALPAFHEDAPLHQSLLSSAVKPRDFADHCITLALGR